MPEPHSHGADGMPVYPSERDPDASEAGEGTKLAVITGHELPVATVDDAGKAVVVKDDGTGYELGAPASPGGSVPDGARIVKAFPFAFDTPDIATGAPLWTPTPGDWLLNAWVVFTEGWDGGHSGAWPTGDIGLVVAGSLAVGWYAGTFPGQVIDMTNVDSPGNWWSDSMLQGGYLPDLATIAVLRMIAGFYSVSGSNLQLDTTSEDDGARIIPAQFTTDDPVGVVVNATGVGGGAALDPAPTQGAGVLYLEIASSASFT